MIKRIAIFLIAVVLMSCGPRLVYPHLDWLIPWYLSDYISLDSDQKSMLGDRLSKLLDWHCRTQLPAYATTLRELRQDLARHSGQLNPAMLQAYSARLTALWKELLQQIGPDITAILATATDAQIDELFVNLEKQNQKFKKEYVDLPPDELVQNRAERMVKRAKYLISKLNAEQKQAVSDWSSQLTPIAEDWLQNRRVVQAEARRLIASRHTDPGFKAAMQEFIINPERMRSADYQRKIDINTTVTINFLVKLDRLLTTEQRSYLLDRLDSLAADFDALARSCNPATTPKPEFN
ncbi:MAG: DUF6279 family lipoprotein [Deltaproteobacteria bacterium]|nr:DUF6279 family lipoprotein [Deltaproteobacteria bacterium]